jgi:ferric-dicitrate binding protein FerR (iron transport regulator)
MHTESRPSETAVPERIVRRAIAWQITLRDAPADSAARQACERWRRRHPHHELAWRRLQAIGEELAEGLARAGDFRPLLRALQTPIDPRRRRLLKSAALGLAALASGWAARECLPWTIWLADYATATGERRDLRLADGSRLQLDTRSAVNLRFDASERRILLEHGALCLDGAADARRRPLRIDCGGAIFEAQDGRFIARRENESALLEVGAGQVGIRPHGVAAITVYARAGERYAVDSAGACPAPPSGMSADGWTTFSPNWGATGAAISAATPPPPRCASRASTNWTTPTNCRVPPDCKPA